MRIIRAVPERGTVNLPFLISSATMLLPSSITAHVQGNIILYIYTRNFQWYITGRITGSQVTTGGSSGLVFVYFKDGFKFESCEWGGVHYYWQSFTF
jgi:hypothetical protein